mgnify:CR=1 FL=1
MLRAFEQHLQENHPGLKQQKLLIACSGGLDSVVLARLLAKLSYNIALAHVNFGLRGAESDEDEAFVRRLAQDLECPFYVKGVETEVYAAEQGISIQMAARELRYGWFEELLSQEFDRLLTAHHADDDLETFLINLSRGAGLKGLTGIPETREAVVRPLLGFERQQLMSYAKKEGWHWREDSSNANDKYLRNAFRLKAIPALREVDEDIVKAYGKTKSHLQASQRLVDDYMGLISKLLLTPTATGFDLDLEKLADLPNQDAILYALYGDYGFTDLVALNQLPKAQSGKFLLAPGYRLLKDRGRLILQLQEKNNQQEVFFIKKDEKNIEQPLRISVKPIGKVGYHDPSTIYVDKALLHYPLEIRKWREGDRFQPFGMQGNKKISKFLKDEKLSLAAKENIWLLCSDQQIVWVVGHRADDRFKVTAATQEILKITYYL